MISGKPRIALFLGSDIVAHRIACDVVPEMLAQGYEPVLYYPKHKPSNDINARQTALQSYAYVERQILAEVIYPFLDAHPVNHGTPCVTPQQLARQYDLHMEAVENVNAPAFIDKLVATDNLAGGFSIRCFQMFGPTITRLMKSDGRFFLNLHPGLLPQFRGIYSTAQELADARRHPLQVSEFGCTLHHIDPFVLNKTDAAKRYDGIDTGNIVNMKARRIANDKTVYDTNIELSTMASDSIKEALRDIFRGNSLRGYPQNNAEGGYFSHPSPAQLEEWSKLGVTMFKRTEVTDTLVNSFTQSGSWISGELRKRIDNALDQKFRQFPFVNHTAPDSVLGRTRSFANAARARLLPYIKGAS